MATAPFDEIHAKLDAATVADISCAGRIVAHDWHNLSEDFITAWAGLAARSSETNPFFEPWGLLPALHAFAKRGDAAILAYYQADQLSGLIPVKHARSYYRYPIPHCHSWSHDNAFCGAPLVLPGSEEGFCLALHQWASANTRTGLFLHLCDIPEDGPFFAALKRIAAAHGPRTAIVHREQRAMLQSAQSPADYFVSAMPGKKRKELRRQFNRLSDEGAITFDRQTTTDGLAEWRDQFLALEAAGWKGREKSALSDDPKNDWFFREILAGAAQAGKLERLQLMLDGRPIAMLATFLTPPGAYSFKTTFDEDYARFSPGVLLQRENLDLLSRRKIRWTDSCAAADHPMIERIWREKRSIIRVNIGLGGKVRQALFSQMLRRESSAQIVEAA